MLSLLLESWLQFTSGLSLPQNQSLWMLERVRTKILEEEFRRCQLRGGDDGSSGYRMQGSRCGRGRGFGGAGRGAKKDDDSNNQQGGTGWGRGAKSGCGGKSGAGGKMKGNCWNQKNGANMVADSSDNNPKSNGVAEKKKERTAGQFFHIGEHGEQGDASANVGAELHPLHYWSNGVAERANRTILETARALLIESGVGNSMWPHAVRHATVARNRVLTKVGHESWVPLERWHGRKPPVDMLRVFGCMAVAHVPKKYRMAAFVPFVQTNVASSILYEIVQSKLPSVGTWDLVEVPEGRKVITSKWLFKIKSDADGKIERYKSRLVAKGYQQKEKVDYKELFAPVVKPTTLRILLAGAAIKGWVVKQMDVTTAFLNGVLKEEIFMAQPEGFDDGSGRVLKLKMALYGLKQAPRQWYLKLQGVLEESGFTPSTADHSLFMLGEGEQRSFMVVYVDDILIFAPSSDLVKEVMLKLQEKFKCKALGDVYFYLGLHVERDVEKRCMRVHQQNLEALAASFVQSDGHVATPFPCGFKCVKGPEEESVGEEERRRFHSLVGSLMYAAVNTRPDVAFATAQLARVVQCPNEEHVAAGMRVVKYLGQTPTVGLQYLAAAQRRQKGADGVEPKRLFLIAFSDASYASEPEDMTSVGGFICCVGGGPTTWESKKQVDKALSSVESEYIALFCTVREIVWQRRLLAELGEEQPGPTPLYCDSCYVMLSFAFTSLNLWPRVSLPETSPTLRWTREVGDASVFRGPAPSGVSQVDPLPGPAPVQEAVGSGIPQGVASGGAASGGAEPGGAESEGAETGGAEPGGVETRGAEPGGAEPEGVEPRGASSEGAESEGASASPLPAPSPYAEQSGSLTERCEPASRPVLPVRPARHVPCSRPPPVPGTHAMTLRPSSVPLRVPLLAPPESSLPEVPNPESDRALATSPTVARLLATAVTDPLFESAIASALVAELLDFAVACRLDYTTALVAESESTSPPSVGGECVLGTDVLEDRQEDFECLAAAVPRFASMLLAPEQDPDAPDIPTPRSYAEAITDPYSFQWQAAMDAKKASWKSTCTYVDEVPPPGANIVDGMWIFRVKRSPRSPPALKACYVARGFSQQQGVDYFQTFSPTPKMTTLRVLLHVAAQRDYELPSLDFSTTFMQGSLHEEICLRRPPCFTESFPAGTQWSLRRLVYGVRQAPREWHHTLRTTLAALGFAAATADPSLFLRTDTSLPPFYVLVYVDDLIFATVKLELQKRHTCTDLGELRSYLGLQITRDRARRTITLTQSHMVHQVLQRFGFQFSSPQPTPLSTSHSLSAPPSDESVEPSGPYPELVGCLIYVMTCTRPNLAYPLSLLARYVDPGRHRKVHWDAAKRVLRYLCGTSGMGLVLGGRGPVVLTGHADASWVDDSATQRLSKGYTFSLGSGSVSWRSTRSSSVLSSSCEAEMYAGAMAVMELHWLTYLLTDLGELPRSPPVLYVDNKAMIALCKDHKLEHRTKHIALRYFLARDLQQHGQLHLAYMSTWANTADIFTKALLVLRLCGDFVIHAKLALLFLTSLVTSDSKSPAINNWNSAYSDRLPPTQCNMSGIKFLKCIFAVTNMTDDSNEGVTLQQDLPDEAREDGDSKDELN
ncbi:unnamed protein product [Closterium sp. NIES-54]